MDWFNQSLLLLISLVANIFSAFAGGGAGLLQFPALIFLGLPFGVALATHKIASVALGVGATIRNLREGSLQRRLTLFIVAFGVPGVVIGANVILFVPDRGAEIALGLLTVGLGLYSVCKPGLGRSIVQTTQSRGHYLLGGAMLFCIGILNGSLTSGTGFVCHALVGALVRAGLQTCRRAHAGIGRAVLEWQRRDHFGADRRNPLGLVASIIAGFVDGRLRRCTSGHYQW